MSDKVSNESGKASINGGFAVASVISGSIDGLTITKKGVVYIRKNKKNK